MIGKCVYLTKFQFNTIKQLKKRKSVANVFKSMIFTDHNMTWYVTLAFPVKKVFQE
jgi:hypothetical protein